MNFKLSWKNAALSFVAAVSLTIAAPSGALTLDWDAIGWDPTDTSGSQTFLNVDGSGIDVTVSYSDNMFFNSSVPVLYDATNSPTAEIEGALKFTNDTSPVLEPTNVTLTFSTDVMIENAFMVSLSIVNGGQEHTVVEAFDAFGAPVLASMYGTTSPALVELDVDGDAAYETLGLGQQSAGEYGNAFWEYTTPVRSLSFSFFSTVPGTDELLAAKASVGIGDVTFVPAPGAGVLLSLALVHLVRRPRRLGR